MPFSDCPITRPKWLLDTNFILNIITQWSGIRIRIISVLSCATAVVFMAVGTVAGMKVFHGVTGDITPIVIFGWVGVAFTAASIAAYFIWIRNKSTSFVLQSIFWPVTVYAALFVSQMFFDDPVDVLELKIEAARQQGISFDDRSFSDEINTRRANGEVVYRYVAPWNPVYGSARGPFTDSEIVQIGGISSVKTLMCNESGEFIYYNSDRNGLNNFDELWDHDGSVEFVFLGDSYTHGLCVNSEDNIVERFRTSYPDALNLGMSSTGPGRYSIIFRSLMRDVDVRKVFVLFYEGNDLQDLSYEVSDQKLRKYTTTPTIPEIDRARMDAGMIEFHEAELFAQTTQEQKSSMPILLKMILLQEVTDRLRTKAARTFVKRSVPLPPFDHFERVFSDLRDVVSNQGGELVFVYLPSHSGIKGVPGACGSEAGCSRVKQEVLSIISGLSINVVDIDDVFRTYEDPLAFFPFRLFGHYTPEGYEVVAGEIVNYVANN
tara:strand:+ start:3394 stop:4866 length:1473 start_codon:yes stop_codon:yes gene_type:complete